MIGWFSDLTEANDWYDERAGTDDWNNLSDSDKNKYLKTAYKRIVRSNKFDIPEISEMSSEDLEKFKDAQGEMSWYLVLHIEDEDRRKGLQVQGVKSAGIVKENYDENKMYDIAIPGIVLEILREYRKDNYGMYGIELERDEDEEDILE